MAEKISEEQLEEYREIFNQFDQDGDGTITAQELGIALKQAGQNFSDLEIQEFMNEIDTDGNGLIDFDEFITLLQRKNRDIDTEEELRELFMVFDRDGDGHITPAELRHVMKTLGENLTEEEVDEIMAEGDKDQNGVITFEGFMNLMIAR